MDQFIAKHADKLQGTLSCFDRVLFRGSLPFYSGCAMASFLDTREVHRRDVRRFVLTQAYRLIYTTVKSSRKSRGWAPWPAWEPRPDAW